MDETSSQFVINPFTPIAAIVIYGGLLFLGYYIGSRVVDFIMRLFK